MIRRWILAAALIAAFAQSPLRAGSTTFTADPASTKLGIAKYVVERTGKVVDVDIRDAGDATMARLEIEFDQPDGTVFKLSKGKTSLRLAWKSSSPTVSVTDMKTGASVKRTMQLAAPHATTTAGTSDLLNKYDKEITLAFTALDQTMTNLGLYQYFFAPKPLLGGPVPPKLGSNCPPFCNGAYIASNPTSAGSRSRCCEIATQSANGNCSNYLCFGCCRIIGCDSGCVLGDFACFCQVTGQACGENPFSCDDTWPPTCT